MNWYYTIATLGPVGYCPAQGSVATIVTLPLVFMLTKIFPSVLSYAAIVVILIIIALWITHKTLLYLHRADDPSEIVIDELIGCIVTFIGIPLTYQSVVMGFIIFRFFDIFKVAGISSIERLPRQWGVVFDDVCAGLISNLIVRFFL